MTGSLSTPYLRDSDIQGMVIRLARKQITDAKVEFVARAVHQATGVAGNPVPWDEDGNITAGARWDERGRQRYRDEARFVLEFTLNNGRMPR